MMENLVLAILATIGTVVVIGFIWLIVEVVREVIDSVTFSSITWKTFFLRVFVISLIIILITAFWYVVLFGGGK